MNKIQVSIGVVGLGYVGLPLLLLLAKKYQVVGYDVDKNRISELITGLDKNSEHSKKEILKNKIKFTTNYLDIKVCNVFIISVPTPAKNNKPDLRNIEQANITVSKVLKKKDIIIYESTVYPGLVEEYCVPQIEKITKFVGNKDFFYGYSPERVNPGDNKKKIQDIIKITSGSSPKVAKKIDNIYKSVIKAGTFPVSSIKIAEAAKVIENTQRDINIALMNELSIIFNKMNLNMREILDAAESKWNFMKFTPGLVGGHCIGVDPYYLSYKAKKIGINPKIILSGRKINDEYYKYICNEIEKYLKLKKIKKKRIKILILGASFKENCKDIRNSQIIKIFALLKKKYNVHIFDPVISSKEILKKYKIKLIKKIKYKYYDYVLIAVGHKVFKTKYINTIKNSVNKNGAINDLKFLFGNKYANKT